MSKSRFLRWEEGWREEVLGTGRLLGAITGRESGEVRWGEVRVGVCRWAFDSFFHSLIHSFIRSIVNWTELDWTELKWFSLPIIHSFIHLSAECVYDWFRSWGLGSLLSICHRRCEGLRVWIVNFLVELGGYLYSYIPWIVLFFSLLEFSPTVETLSTLSMHWYLTTASLSFLCSSLDFIANCFVQDVPYIYIYIYTCAIFSKCINCGRWCLMILSISFLHVLLTFIANCFVRNTIHIYTCSIFLKYTNCGSWWCLTKQSLSFFLFRLHLIANCFVRYFIYIYIPVLFSQRLSIAFPSYKE